MNWQMFDYLNARGPSETAVLVFEGSTLTSDCLRLSVERLSGILRSSGLGRTDVVALACDSPLDAFAGMLAVIQAGGVFVQINPRLSAARAQRVLDDSGAVALIGTPQPGVVFAGLRIQPDQAGSVTELSRPRPTIADQPDSPAALVYLSRHTGRQEATTLSRANLANAVSFISTTLKLDLSRTLCAADWLDEASFVMALATLSQGGTVHFASAGADVAELIAREQIGTLALPLGYLSAYQANDYSALRGIKHLVSFGNDAIAANPIKQALKAASASWHNFYGFPEFQFVSTPKSDDANMTHVGKPALQVQAVILDSARQLVPVGLPGELYVSGRGVCAGSPALGAEQFIDHPFTSGERLYRTGCSARWRANGRIEIINRTDGQISSGGCRITLAEIEATLATHPALVDCAVVQRTNADGTALVTAFVVSPDDLHRHDLDQFLNIQLAPHLLPVGLIQLDRLPRTAQGTIDRAALAELTALDSTQIKRLEQTLRVTLGIQDLALVARQQRPQPALLHLSDVLPRDAALAPVSPTGTVAAAHMPQTDQQTRPLALALGEPVRETADTPATLTDALLAAATRYPDHGVRYVYADGRDQLQRYPALLTDAQRILAGLRANNLQPGAHLLFQLDRNEDFIPAFWAAILGGFIPVPLSIPPTYDPSNTVVAKLHNAWTLLSHPVLLTREQLQPPLRSAFAALDDQPLTLLPVEQLRAFMPDTLPHTATPDDTALLLLTSGSTGMPKGVVLSHSNLIARSRGTAQMNSFTSDDISFNWMPLDHVGGIVMFHIRDVCTGCTQIHAQTDTILENPVRWLDVIERYRATVTWAPNFAYALINDRHEQVNQLQRDLSSMRFILNGGEAVNARTAYSFLRLLKPHGLPPHAIHPAYGMSETSSGITYSDALSLDSSGGVHHLDQTSLTGTICPAEPGAAAVTFVEVGRPIPGMALRIVDGDNRVLREGIVGRLQVSGPTVTSGYYNNTALNAEVFTADGWFTTGDLAFLLDGRLTITGREKDVIIINGVNYHSHEVEATVEEVDGVEVSYTAACAVRGRTGATEDMVVFFSSRFDTWEQQAAQMTAIRQAITQKIGLSPLYVLPVEKEAIPKTAIGKIQRTQLSQQFTAGHFDALTRQIDLHTANERTLPDWFFTKTWRAQALPITAPARASGYVLFTDDTPLSRALTERLAAQKLPCINVRAADAFARLDQHTYMLDLSSAEDYAQMLAALSADGITISEYVHLVGYAAYSGPIEHLADLHAANERGVFSILRLTQALAQAAPIPARLTVVTSYAQAVLSSEPVAAEKATVSGLLKTIPLELDWLTCRHIDLDLDESQAHSARLADELALPRGAAEVAYRAGQRLIPGFRRANMQPQPTQPIVQGGLYMITGGLGGIGTRLARWLATNYGARLLLVGSTRLPSGSLQPDGTLDNRTAKRVRAYNEIVSSGADVQYQALDISDPAQIREAIAQAETRWSAPLAGIFHFAGEGNLNYHWSVMDQHRVAVERLDTFEMMFQPKVYGTWALHQAVKDRPDLLIVVSSSVNSFFGGATFCAYAAANSFLDSFARYQRTHSHPRTVCLNWSVWDNIGMSADNPEHMQRISRQRGYLTVGVSQGLSSLLAGAAHNYDQLFVGLDSTNPQITPLLAEPFDYQPMLKLYVAEAAMYSHEQVEAALGNLAKQQPLDVYRIPQIPRLASGAVDIMELERIGQQTDRAAAPSGAPTNEIEERLLVLWQEVLGKPNIGIYDNFFALGGHSLLATQLVSRVREIFNLEVRLHQLFETPTVVGLAGIIAQGQMAQVDVADMSQLFAEIDGLSAEELDLLLNM